jgi:ABC-type multidrug transport system permease subunit
MVLVPNIFTDYIVPMPLASRWSTQFEARKANVFFVCLFATIFQITIIAVVVSTLYIRTNMHHNTINDGQVYFGLLFFLLMFITTTVLPEQTYLVLRLPVYYKEKELSLYPAWALAIPVILLRIPWSIVETASVVVVVYYSTGLSSEPERQAYGS